jgi:predicted alpha/beta-fold hydrolase
MNARNDPFLPARYLPRKASSSVILEYPAQGGHVGFASGYPPGSLQWLPKRLVRFLSDQVLLQPGDSDALLYAS